MPAEVPIDRPAESPSEDPSLVPDREPNYILDLKRECEIGSHIAYTTPPDHRTEAIRLIERAATNLGIVAVCLRAAVQWLGPYRSEGKFANDLPPLERPQHPAPTEPVASSLSVTLYASIDPLMTET